MHMPLPLLGRQNSKTGAPLLHGLWLGAKLSIWSVHVPAALTADLLSQIILLCICRGTKVSSMPWKRYQALLCHLLLRETGANSTL